MATPEDFESLFTEREIHSFKLKSMNNLELHLVALSQHDKRSWINGVQIHRQFIEKEVNNVTRDTPYLGWEVFFEAGDDVLLRKSMAYPDGSLMWEGNNEGYSKFLKKVTSKSGIIDEIIKEILKFNAFASDLDQKKNEE